MNNSDLYDMMNVKEIKKNAKAKMDPRTAVSQYNAVAMYNE